jgi:SAM-dependent methyltransferase
MRNYFAYQTAAERYARSRPYFHPLVISRIKEYIRPPGPVPQVLDVGCGTGLSALALTAIAEHVTGTDISPEMLAQAHPDARIQYVAAPAESLPFRDSTIDLLTASLAFHWFVRERFLAEAHRLLRSSAWLVIYNNAFTGRMQQNPDYEEWDKQRYRGRYPTPPRHSQALGSEDAARFGFRLEAQESYTNDVKFTAEQLAGYLTTQSNVIAAVEQGAESSDEVFQWLLGELSPLFPSTTATFGFRGSISYYRRV